MNAIGECTSPGPIHRTLSELNYHTASFDQMAKPANVKLAWLQGNPHDLLYWKFARSPVASTKFAYSFRMQVCQSWAIENTVALGRLTRELHCIAGDWSLSIR